MLLLDSNFLLLHFIYLDVFKMSHFLLFLYDSLWLLIANQLLTFLLKFFHTFFLSNTLSLIFFFIDNILITLTHLLDLLFIAVYFSVLNVLMLMNFGILLNLTLTFSSALIQIFE